MKDCFKARIIWNSAIQTLSDAEAGRLMKSVWQYAATGEEPRTSGVEKGMVALIVETLRQDALKEEELSKKRAQAGSAGGKQKVANRSKRKQNVAKVAIATDATENEKEQFESAYESSVPGVVANATFATEKNQKNGQIAEEEKRTKKEEDNNVNTSNKEKEIYKEKEFDRFWKAYPRHEAKQTAKQKWMRLNLTPDLMNTIMTAVEQQKQSDQWNRDGGQYIPMPSTWINQKRWEDELPQGVNGNGFCGGNAGLAPTQDYSDLRNTGLYL